ncbi:hypothetical protein [Peristeroidobacter soli]|uniref:hypothetical protein n=1 Tax=Peristeroidobacter soli TaxID=2497877 RepID=UPI00101C0E5A|nr:hypothetical protein [Peristeroidobacter soli]
MTAQYSTRYISQHLTVSLVEVAATSEQRTLQVVVHPGGEWRVDLPIWYLPGVAILDASAIALWAGARFHLLVPGKAAVSVDLEDEVHAIYGVGSSLCIVSELSVLLYEPTARRVLDRFDADDVLGESWWEERRLMVQASSGAALVFTPTPTSLAMAQST